jgi:hypothetical protein
MPNNILKVKSFYGTRLDRIVILASEASPESKNYSKISDSGQAGMTMCS